jgi:hypothetical protein
MNQPEPKPLTELNELYMFLESAMKTKMTEDEVVAEAADDKIKTIGDLLFKLGCLMRKQDIEDEKMLANTKNAKYRIATVTVKGLKLLAKKYPGSPVAMALNKGVVSWLTSHGSSKKRYLKTSSKKCDGKGYGTGYEAGGLVKGLKAIGGAVAGAACVLGELQGGTRCNIGGTTVDTKINSATKKEKRKKTKVREEMPAYLLNAITNEKPVHPVYGKLRY